MYASTSGEILVKFTISCITVGNSLINYVTLYLMTCCFMPNALVWFYISKSTVIGQVFLG